MNFIAFIAKLAEIHDVALVLIHCSKHYLRKGFGYYVGCVAVIQQRMKKGSGFHDCKNLRENRESCLLLYRFM